MSPAPLVPDGFAIPAGIRSAQFVLEPLGLQHNESDHAAWTASLALSQARLRGPLTWPTRPGSCGQAGLGVARRRVRVRRPMADMTGLLVR
jgi:hypothetical protein